MRNASLLRPQTVPASAAIDSQVDQVSQPHIFRAERTDSPRELGQLFNLRRRPGYYNAEAKAALLRRAKQPPHDELFVDFTSSQVQIGLSAAGIPLASGDWTWQASANHEPLVSESPWSAVCWRSEKA